MAENLNIMSDENNIIVVENAAMNLYLLKLKVSNVSVLPREPHFIWQSRGSDGLLGSMDPLWRLAKKKSPMIQLKKLM